MATTAVGISDIADTLEKIIQPYLQDNIPTDTIFLDQVKRNTNVQEFNDNFYAPIRSTRHGGIVNLATDKGKLRTGNAGRDQASVPVKILTGTFDLTELADKGSTGKKKAVINEMTMQAQTLRADFVKNANRQYFSDGYGVIGQVAGSVGSGTLSVVAPDSNCDDGRVEGAYGKINGDISPVEYFSIGQAIGIGTAGADAGTISSISYTRGGTSGTIVVTGAPAIAANDALYLLDGDEAGAGTSEIWGVRRALGAGTADYASVPRSVEVWAPQVSGTSANAALTFSDMSGVYMSAKKYANKGDRFAWFMNQTLYRKYGDILTAQRRIVDSKKLLGGWSGLAFEVGGGEIGVFLDYDVPDGEAILINLDSWTICQVSDMGFLEGGKMDRRTDYLSYQTVFRWYTNNLCVAPAANGRLVRKTG